MKSQQLRIPVVGVFMACLTGLTEGARERMTVEEDDITFKVDLFDDGRSNPYKVTFTEDGITSIFRLDGEGKVAKINVGSDKYEVEYKSNGDLKEVELTSSRRILSALDPEEVDEERVALENRRRNLYACSDCQETWETVCDEGVPTVCDLVGYGSPVLDTAEAAIATMCETFGAACSRSGGVEACDGQCEDDESDDDSDSSTTDVVLNSCLDPASDDYKCNYAEGDSPFVIAISFDGCGLVDEDAAYLSACFETFGKLLLNYVELDNNLLTTLPEDVFDGLVELGDVFVRNNQLVSLPVGLFSSQNVYLDQLWLTGNQLTTLPEGIFDPLTGIFSLGLDSNPDLQCVPTNSAYEVYVDSDDILEGTCECEPVEAVTCDEGSSCQSGAAGYTCE